ncbi:MAG: hypothetical protein M1480_14845 [Bacteroidetes bacterium]|nr:hypothetical protein [Bacteroidota bacterium]
MFSARIIILFSAFFFICGCGNKGSNSAADDNQESISDAKLASTLSDFYFVGKIGENPGLYKFNAEKKIVSRFWSNKKEKIVELSYAPNRKNIFFLTASDFGKKGVFPFISNVKLYLINLDSSKVKLVRKIGGGLQIFTTWTTDNTFKIILNSFDRTVVTYVNQQTFIFSEFGRELVNKSKIFDITKDGYPKPPEKLIKAFSPKNEFRIIYKDSSITSIYLKSKNKETVITSGEQKLNQVEWTSDNKFVIFSTIDITPRNKTLYDKLPDTSQLFVYDLKQKKIIKTFKGGGIKNFFINNNFLIFDDGFGKNSSIQIYNYKTLEPVQSIKIKGGCGLRNVPQIPDYSA